MRILATLLILVLLPVTAMAEDRQKLLAARRAAQRLVQPSGPVLFTPTSYTPAHLEPNSLLAGNLRSQSNRYVYTRETYPWFTPYRYGYVYRARYPRYWCYPCW